jgi:NOL1/NOP2/sun family putative RNA methylase
VKKIYPGDFIHVINDLLKEEAPLFWAEVENGSPTGGLRTNPSKTTLADLQEYLALKYQPLSWSVHGIALQTAQALGKQPYHAAGLYYLQEPSAMVPVAVLDPQPGEYILDLCAAPGGKTSQIQARMGNTGLLIANDPNPKRVQALCRNLERWGTRNTAVLCDTPKKISEHLGSFFDRVLVDAPCSGEGTFRSDPGESRKWSLNFSKRCAQIQDEILWFAAKLVKPGGVLVYATCTFNKVENEARIARFLENNPEFALDPVDPLSGYSQGIQLDSAPAIDFSGVVRIWPHKTLGEGHFAARLVKSSTTASPASQRFQDASHANQDHLYLYRQFFENTLQPTAGTDQIQPGSKGVRQFGNRLYWIPDEMPALAGLGVCHWGWWLGTFQTERFTPSPALASALMPEDAQKVLEFPLGDPNLRTYLRGSPLATSKLGEPPEGWNLVTCTGYSMGWGLVHQNRMKSYFPRWLRFS